MALLRTSKRISLDTSERAPQGMSYPSTSLSTQSSHPEKIARNVNRGGSLVIEDYRLAENAKVETWSVQATVAIRYYAGAKVLPVEVF